MPIRDVDPDALAWLFYSSGTTGRPKGAELTHFNMYSNAQYCSEQLMGEPGQREIFGPGDVSLSALPLFHSFGQTCNQNSSIMGGAALTYLERFDPEAALEVMERDRVTQFAGVPTMYFALLNFEGKICIGNAERVKAGDVGIFYIGLVDCYLGHAHPVLLTGSNTGGAAVFDINNRVGSYPMFHCPAEDHVIELSLGWLTLAGIVFPLPGGGRRFEIIG